MRTLILSDLHLGSRHSNTALINETLSREPFERLILNGDTLHSLNLRKLDRDHWSLLERIRNLSRDREVVLIRGNHDHDFDYIPSRKANSEGEIPIGTIKVLPSLLEMPMREEYRLDAGCKSYLVLHGDRFDPTLNYPALTEVAGFCYQLTTKVNKKLAKWLKKKSKRWGGVLEFVRARSIAHAEEEGYQGVITGHTHFAEDAVIGDLHYLNTGCWTEYPYSYVVVDGPNAELNHPSD